MTTNYDSLLEQACKAKESSESAFPGPWVTFDANAGDDPAYRPFWVVGRDDREDNDEYCVELHVGDKWTADFLADSITSVPALADGIIELAEELQRYKAAWHELAEKEHRRPKSSYSAHTLNMMRDIAAKHCIELIQ